MGTKSLYHPVAGELTLDWDTLTASTDPDQQLVIWTAAPDTPSYEGLRFLASWASTATRTQRLTGHTDPFPRCGDAAFPRCGDVAAARLHVRIALPNEARDLAGGRGVDAAERPVLAPLGAFVIVLSSLSCARAGPRPRRGHGPRTDRGRPGAMRDARGANSPIPARFRARM